MPVLRHTFNLKNNNPFVIEVPLISDRNGEFVKINQFSSAHIPTNPTIDDWKVDTQLYCSELSQQNMGHEQSYLASFLKVCSKHIYQYGRIIDSDLFTYIDEAMMVVATLVKNQGDTLSLTEGKAMWNHYKNFAFDRFEADLYVNVSTPNPLSRTILVSYADFKSGNYNI